MTKDDFLKKYDMEEITQDDGVIIDIIYNTSNNFFNKKLYDEPICMLRKKTKEKLINANKVFNKLGYKIKIWDTFRPYYIQEAMWSILPDKNFVCNPNSNDLYHPKGHSVDITLCTLDGKELKMPTKFDHFGIESNRCNYKLCDTKTIYNVMLLEDVMSKCGFIGLDTEWWHFYDSDEYNVINEMFD